MQCQTCAAPLEAGAQFCPFCGTRVTNPSSVGAPTTTLPGPEQSYQQLGQPPGGQQWIAPVQPASPPNSTAAVVSLIFGILCWLPVLPFIGAIVAVIAGHMARNQIRDSNGALGGAGMAKVGMILGYVHLAVVGLVLCVGLALFVLALAAGTSGR